MHLEEMYTALDQIPERHIDLSDRQKEAIEHGTGPLWIIAGPGSGKTEVLVLRSLKLLCVDLVPSASVMITTFTEKGARSLRDRLATYKRFLEGIEPSLEDVDLSRLWIGTLHSLCNDIMQRYRYQDYQNVRLLDDLEQRLFIYDHADLAGRKPSEEQLELWKQFQYLMSWSPDRDYPPNRWMRTKASIRLFNRIVQDMLDVHEMSSVGGVSTTLADAYKQYKDALVKNYRCDFAHLQQHFLKFLETPNGQKFLHGDGTPDHPGVQYFLVDEYQDTNPIQEAIYLRLAGKSRHNLTVVGDDDQALYRFRGGTVECMVTFAEACQRAWGISANSVRRIALMNNYRSHPGIVRWCDKYIRSFSLMNQPGARSPAKPSLEAASGITGDYPSVALISGRTYADVTTQFADMVENLIGNGIAKPEQCAILLHSVRETPRRAGPYVNALRERGLSVYNPRSRTFLEQEEVQAALGALVEILDPTANAQRSVRGRGIQSMVNAWRNRYTEVSRRSQELREYVEKACNRISQMDTDELIFQSSDAGETAMAATLQEVFYHILSFEPFVTWQEDLERSLRLGKLTKVMETYSSVPSPFSGEATRGYLRTSSTAPGQVSFRWRQRFYYSLVGFLVNRKLNDPEDEEVICPPGRVPVMTVYQAKGLEFPFVFVAGLNRRVKPDATHCLEDALRKFRQLPSLVKFDASERALQDLVRFFYVAYSRAQHALILLATNQHVRNERPAFGGRDRDWFRKQMTIL